MAVAAASSSLPPLTDGQLYYFVVEHTYVKQDSLSQDFAFSGSQCGDIFSCHNSVGEGVEDGGATDI